MWQEPWQLNSDVPNFRFEHGISEFGLFLETAVCRVALAEFRYQYPNETISLMELLELWLWRGLGLDFCPNHESFLVTAIRIIDHWHQHGCKKIDNNSLWEVEGAGIAIPLMPAESRRSGSEKHRLLSREVFEQLQSQVQAKEQQNLLERIDEIFTNAAGNQPA